MYCSKEFVCSGTLILEGGGGGGGNSLSFILGKRTDYYGAEYSSNARHMQVRFVTIQGILFNIEVIIVNVYFVYVPTLLW